jgi:hypothetical protein
VAAVLDHHEAAVVEVRGEIGLELLPEPLDLVDVDIERARTGLGRRA